MAKKINFSGISAAYVKGMQGAAAAYTAGVNGVTVSPGQLAAAQVTKWAANTAAAENKWANNVGAVSLPSWQTACTSKASRLGTGAQAAAPKLDKYYAANGNQIQALADSIRASRANGATGEDRVAAWMAGMKQIAGK